jgi:hypothetical protein
MKFDTFEIDSEGRWCFMTGGVTEKSVTAVKEFTERYAPPTEGWQFHSVDLIAKCPLDYEGNPSEETTVIFNFIRGDEIWTRKQSLLTDGFSWGYGGTGPFGLAYTLTYLCNLYGILPLSSNSIEILKRWVFSRDQDKDYMLLAKDIFNESFGD